MKKILQINSCVNNGSTGYIAEQIGQVILSQGWESIISYGRKSKQSKSRLLKIGNSLSVILHGLETRLFDNHGFSSRYSTQKFINEIKKIKPDLIHIHNIHGYYINMEELFHFLEESELPVVWTLHDCWPFTGHCAHFTAIDCNKWKTHCFKCPQKRSYPCSLLLDRSNRNFYFKKKIFTSIKKLTIVTVSNWLNSVVQESFLSSFPTITINNGIDVNIFKNTGDSERIRTKYGIGNKFMLLALATSWSDQKGLNDYIRLSTIISIDTVIVLVGLTKSQQKELPKKIICIPRTNNIDELVQLYSAADVTLNLSAEETFGLTTVEGFSCGVPGIVYNCTASPELITSDTGFIVDKGDVYGILEAINTIKSTGKLKFSQFCRDRAVTLYNSQDRYMEYINLYKTLL